MRSKQRKLFNAPHPESQITNPESHVTNTESALGNPQTRHLVDDNY